MKQHVAYFVKERKPHLVVSFVPKRQTYKAFLSESHRAQPLIAQWGNSGTQTTATLLPRNPLDWIHNFIGPRPSKAPKFFDRRAEQVLIEIGSLKFCRH